MDTKDEYLIYFVWMLYNFKGADIQVKKSYQKQECEDSTKKKMVLIVFIVKESCGSILMKGL